MTGSDFTNVSILGSETIMVGQHLTSHIAQTVVTTIPASSYIVVTDKNVAPYHLATLTNELQAAIHQNVAKGNAIARILTYILPPGEAAKTREVKAQIEDWMLEQRCTRDSCILALGGGVIGDMLGFVAATFMRGIPFVQIPTTLLAMVDSSIGGKTAVDTPAGKNLIGAFHQPKRIFIDVDYLKTLPHREFVNGMAEVIKTAAIWVEEDFDLLENHPEEVMAFANTSKSSVKTDTTLLKRVILGSVKVKAHVVTVDEKETGLRNLLNFGHSIGHAMEAILAPNILHGECVSMGMVREAEIARHLGHLSEVAVGRLVRCLQSYGLPISLEDKKVLERAPGKHCSVDQLLDIMRVDKKNQGDQKRIVMLAGIGKCWEPRATFIPDVVIRKILSPAIRVQPPSITGSEHYSLAVPGSKSISNRALVFAALGQGTCRLRGLLHSDDVQVMLDALQKLVGITYVWEDNGDTLVIQGGGGQLRVPDSEIYLGNAGTASRFLTTVCALVKTPGSNRVSTIVTGNARMKQRPIGPLFDALTANGANVKYLESKGSLPLEITPDGHGLKGGIIHLSAEISSQYVSSILMSAPYAENAVTLILTGNAVVSQPYIDMTTAMMESFGIKVTRDPSNKNVYYIPKGVYKNPSDYLVEADASSATYPLAFAAITGVTVTVTNMGSQSLQGDSEFATKVLGAMGCHVKQTASSTTVKGPTTLSPIPSIDMESMTDAFLTASVLAGVAAPHYGSNVTRITGIANQRVKECNRIAAMVEQLAEFGVDASELPDGIEIHGKDRTLLHAPKSGVKCYDDHRIAMSFSVLACALNPTHQSVIKEKKCVEKTYPTWWDTLENIMKVPLVGIDMHEATESSTPALAKVQANGLTNGTSHNYLQHATTVIIGMRGAGKTHLGRSLAASLQRRFIDMDDYLESALGTTIPQLIADKGWTEFRQQETKFLAQVLEEQPTGLVIACGGGIVETPAARETLKKWSGAGQAVNHRRGHVIHVKRDMSDVVAYLNIDKTRPMIGEDMMVVWDRRKGWYDECSSAEFVIVKHPIVPSSSGSMEVDSDDSYWTKVERDLTRVVRFITSTPTHPTSTTSFFVALTCGNVRDVADRIDRITEGSDAVELRVDLLKSTDVEYVAEQVALLRRMTELPIIFTVRTKTQNGAFPNDKAEDMFDLLNRAVKWGCEYIDLEVEDMQQPARKRMTERLIANKGPAHIIASYHDVTGTATWEDLTAVTGYGSGLGTTSSSRNKKAGVSMRDKYIELHPYGDIVKLVGTAHDMEDNYSLQRFLNRIVTSLGLRPSKPIIAINMRKVGQLSRVLNEYLTPVTHSALAVAAAPGQLTITELNQARSLLGLLDAKKYYLFGAPIKQSMSPTIHNTGFHTLGLPHKYELSESPDWRHVQTIVTEGLANGTFGGASVTIPLKEDVVKHGIVQRTTAAAQSIGAVNTLMVETTSDGSKIVVGDNTDWIGIKRALQARMPSLLPNQPIIGVVVGAGGTARAACFALKSMNVTELRLWNRTGARAQDLASAFGGRAMQQLDWCLAPYNNSSVNAPPPLYLVVGTIPAPAQSQLPFNDMYNSAAAGCTGVVVEMAYRPRDTPLLSQASRNFVTCEGIEVLIEQGLEQFERWTERHAPRAAITAEVMARY
ncbi:hypothetical protein SmJEL517_g02883 [Synchytrium microbalum]|uniref:Pentafunctional AROM polypeptide n=1 Tax=Synchytrium microbalum TaxID=1806994 RepID=A0A507C915_9FUNG|nr:uncharacterized protein SmJEL517_g02883 [Synchytrium microbalum]TPX34464.1 hypothetical protein SmJEL517_g02883 [Synchytrium microbalum]